MASSCLPSSTIWWTISSVILMHRFYLTLGAALFDLRWVWLHELSVARGLLCTFRLL
jgi:hypothetical protein